jgi:hypothetical protein
LAVIYDQTSGESRQFMQNVHQEQGATAVDYTDSTFTNISPRATQLYEAINGGVFGLGTDTGKLFQALRNVTPAEYNELQRVYKDHYNRDLTADIKGDLSGNDLKRAECLLRGETHKADAYGLREAMGGFGTDVDEVHSILSKQGEDSQLLKDTYKKEFNRDLETNLKTELSGRDLRQAKAFLRGEQVSNNAQPREQVTPLAEANQLFKAMDGLGTNEATIHAILKGRTKEEIQSIRSAYESQYDGRNLDADLQSELSGRDLFDAEMSLRGSATTAKETLSRMNERYDYDRGGNSNLIGRFVTDTFSDQGALLDRNHQRANSFYQQAMSDSQLDKGERTRLNELTGYVNDDVGSYQNAKDGVADAAGTVAATFTATAVVVGSAGTATPLVSTLLMAGGAGGVARVTTAGVIEGRSYGIEDAATDGSIGAIDGLATVSGMKAGTAAAQGVLKATATNSLKNEGLQVTERAVAKMSHEILENSTKARVTFGAIEGSVDGAIGGALGGAGTTAASDGTWDQGLAEGFERVGDTVSLNGGLGIFGGALGGAAFGRNSTHLADDMMSDLSTVEKSGKSSQEIGAKIGEVETIPYHIRVQTEMPATIKRLDGSTIDVPAHQGPVFRGIRPPEGVSLEEYVDKIVKDGGFPQTGTNFDIENQVLQGPNSGLAGATTNRENARAFALTDRHGTQYKEGLMIEIKAGLPSYDTQQAYELAGRKIPITGEVEYSIHSGLPLEYIESIQIVKSVESSYRGKVKIELGELLYP